MRKFCIALLAALCALCAVSALAEGTLLVIPADVTRLEDDAFLNAGAEAVRLPEGIRYIGENAFAGMPLRTINLPYSLRYIAPGAFAGCNDLVATVVSDSYAQSYCDDNGIDYIETDKPAQGGSYHDYAVVTNEMEIFCVQASQSTSDLNVLCNCFDGLLTNDANGALIGAAACSWYSSDDIVWTFTLNSGMAWVDYQGSYRADVTGDDFAWAFEWILNPHKNTDKSNTGFLWESLDGAWDYTEYVRTLTPEEGVALGLDTFYDMVGMAVSGSAITFTCTQPTPYFPTICCYSAYSPVSGALLRSVGPENYIDISYDQLWYNGPYTISDYSPFYRKVLKRNPLYYNAEAALFDEVVIYMVESSGDAYEMFGSGEVDQVDLKAEEALEIYNDPSHPFHRYLTTKTTGYSYQIHFNFEKLQPDGSNDADWNTAVANESFRKAWYYGIDFSTYLALSNPILPLAGENYTYTNRNISLTSSGLDYTDLVLDRIGLSYDHDTYNRCDANLAAGYIAQARSELTAAGVELPVTAAYYYFANNESAQESAAVLKQCIEAGLGGLVQVDLRAYTGNQAHVVRNPQLYSFMINGWGADYADPGNFLSQETLEDTAYYTANYSHGDRARDEALQSVYAAYTDMVQYARTVYGDRDARYAAFADAEAYLIDHCLTIPLYVNTTWQLSRAMSDSKISVSYGSQSSRYVNWQIVAGGAR